MSKLSHIDDAGRAHMVDVSGKTVSERRAMAIGQLRCDPATLALVKAGKAPKGAVISTAELAGIMAAKQTSILIPLCHPLPLSKVAVTIEMAEHLPGFIVHAEVKTTGVTGIEMEALTAVSISCLTLYDMLKAVDKTMVIGEVKLIKKSGGKSGDWTIAIAQSEPNDD